MAWSRQGNKDARYGRAVYVFTIVVRYNLGRQSNRTIDRADSVIHMVATKRRARYKCLLGWSMERRGGLSGAGVTCRPLEGWGNGATANIYKYRTPSRRETTLAPRARVVLSALVRKRTYLYSWIPSSAHSNTPPAINVLRDSRQQ